MNETRITAMNSDEKRRVFKEQPVEHFVRDEGVAGSNPATPTTFSSIRASTPTASPTASLPRPSPPHEPLGR